MQESFAGAWTESPRLLGESLGALRDLNLRFLDLLTRVDGWRPRLGLAAPVLTAIEALSPPHRAALAGCPYALFDLRFADEAHWRARLSAPRHWRVADQSDQPESREFAGLSLFYAWHVAARGVEPSQLQLGMGRETVLAFRRVRLNELALLAEHETEHLRARWHQYPAFWNALIAAAGSADPLALKRTQLYGLQLTAAARLS
ncbi:MAG TPA: hypothetical protein VGI93_13895 [Steroidobacteraceae bacterium]|jgi:hypothetical protein